MDSDRPLIATGSLTDATSVLIPLQNFLAQTAEVFLILTLERIAGWTQSKRNDTGPPTWTTQAALNRVLQFPTPFAPTARRRLSHSGNEKTLSLLVQAPLSCLRGRLQEHVYNLIYL
jgi:hypothetical protein